MHLHITRSYLFCLAFGFQIPGAMAIAQSIDILHVDSRNAQRHAAPKPPSQLLSADYEFDRIAESGDEPPGRSGAVFGQLRDVSLNSLGEVAFKGDYSGVSSGNQGIYIFRAGALERVLDDGFDFMPPGQSGASSYTGFGPPVINDLGHIGFAANISFADGNEGLYVWRNGTVDRVFDNNPLDSVPTQPAGSSWSAFPFTAGISAVLSGQDYIATIARFRDPAFNEFQSIVLGTPMSGAIMAANSRNSVPPGQGSGARYAKFDSFMVTAEGDDVVFVGSYTGGAGSAGVYRYSVNSGSLIRVADGSQGPADQPGAIFTGFDIFPSANENGYVVFGATAAGGSAARGLYRSDGASTLETIVDTSGSFVVPGHPTKNFSLFGPPVTNSAGDVVFVAEFGFGPDDVGVFVRSASKTIKIMDLADPVPGQPDASFSLLGSPIINASGEITLTARYTGGTGTEGIYFWDGDSLERVVDESQNLFGRMPTNLSMMLGIGGSGGQDGKGRSLNDAGQIAFRATFSDGSHGVYLASPPIDCGPRLGMTLSTIASPGNDPDSNGLGAVSREFRIGTYEVTNTEYVEFLNAVAVDDPNSLYNSVMTTSLRAGILRSGSPGSYVYSVKPNFDDKPASGFSWLGAARYCNWLHNGKPNGQQDTTTTELGAYDLSLPLEQIFRLPGARWFLPSEDEWYKAAHYDPNDPGADADGTPDYWSYPMSTDAMPVQAHSDAFGYIVNPGPLTANYARGVDWNGTDCDDPSAPCGNVSTVGSAGSISPWGCFDMGGNIYEWTDTPGRTIQANPPSIPEPLPTRTARGGDFANSIVLLGSNLGIDVNLQAGAANLGMRVATIACTECLADVNGDGILSATDFTAWIAAFNSGASACDQNNDMACSPTDFTAWITNFNEGCQ
jgi:formylglycine-generating enzyme required for sulfatase activity